MVIPRLHIGGRLLAYLLGSLAYAALATYVVMRNDAHWDAGGEIVAAIGVPLGILLVFRNNTAHDRWWEARKLWGQLTNDCRNLALKVRAHADLDTNDYRRFAKHLIAFPEALRLHLRGERSIRAVPGFAEVGSEFPHSPGYFAELIHRDINHWNRAGKLRDTVWVLDVHARSLLDVCGAASAFAILR
ncbi:MAG: bestrophin family ion channel [Pirellulales bacterium]